MDSGRSIVRLFVITLAWFPSAWAVGQVPGPGSGNAVMERGCFSCYSTQPTRAQLDAASIRTAGADISIAAETTQYAEIDTLVVVYPHYSRNYAGGRVQADLSAADIETLKAEAAQSQRFLWRSSNLKCLMKLQWMVMERTLTPAQIWEVSDDAYWLTFWSIDGSTSVEQDLRNAGVANGRYSVVVVLYAFENSDGAGAAYGGGAYGVDIGFLGDTAYIAIPLAWGLDCDGYITHEYLHALDSIFTASGNPRGNDMGHADQPGAFRHPADGGRHFNFLLSNTLAPESWLWLSAAWARPVTASDDDGDGVPDRGELPITEEILGSSATRSDTDNDGLSDLDELVASFIGELNPLHPDTDADGLMDLQDPYPLYQCNDQVPKGEPQVDGIVDEDEYAEIARLPVAGNADLETAVYAAWSEGMLYLAADVTDNRVEAPYQEPFWHFDDNVEIDIDGLRDGWLTGGDSNYRFYFVPTGTRSRPHVFGFYGSRDNGGTEWRDLDTAGIAASYRLRHGGYTIEAAIPAEALNASGSRVGNVPLKAGATVRATFSVRDYDAYGDWPSLNVLTGMDEDVRGFVLLHLADDDADPAKPFDACGALVQGASGTSSCTLFQADTSELYFLDNLGGFAVGTRVRVQGTVKAVCGNTPREKQAQGGNTPREKQAQGCTTLTLELNFQATLSPQVSGISAADGTWSASLDSTTAGPGVATVKLCITGTNVNAGVLPCAETSEVASVTLSLLPGTL